MAPVAALLAALVAMDRIGRGEALAAGVILALVFLLIQRRRAKALAQIIELADALTRGDEAGPTPAARGLAADLATAVVRLDQAGRARGDRLTRMIEAREAILDSLPDAVLMIDAQRHIVRGNLAARRLFEVAINGRDLVAVMRQPQVLEAVDAVLEGGAPRTVDVALTDPVERDFRVGVQRLPARAPDGTVAIAAWHDVTALRRSERMRGDFVANASHELRTPLASLMGFIETLQGPARDDEEARERFLRIMHDQAHRMARLIEDLMSLSRIEMNEHERPTDRVDLEEVIDHVVAAIELEAARRKVRLSPVIAQNLPPVTGSADELTQVLHNLVDNALKYGKPGTMVTITARPAESVHAAMARPPHGAVAISVRDQGDGIAREHLPRLTERFYRVDAARSRAAGGTGLGLAIVKHIMSRHRGALAIDSEIGRGSVFTIYLPIAPPLAEKAKTFEAPARSRPRL